MADELDGVRAKLARAQEQFNALSADLITFLNGEPFASYVEFDEEARDIAFGIEVRQKPPLEFSVIIGEILHDLRSALDHALWQLVIHDGATPHDRTGFPIYWKLDGFEGECRPHARRKGMLLGLNSSSIDAVKGMQPFSTGEGTNSPLWMLHELHNLDKHRTLILAAAQIQRAKVSLGPHAAGSVFSSPISVDEGPYETDTIIYRQHISNWFEGPLQADVTSATYGVAFGKDMPPSVSCAEVRSILDLIGRRVYACIAQIDALF